MGFINKPEGIEDFISAVLYLKNELNEKYPLYRYSFKEIMTIKTMDKYTEEQKEKIAEYVFNIIKSTVDIKQADFNNPEDCKNINNILDNLFQSSKKGK